MQDQSDENLDYLWQRRHKILHDVALSVLYHRRRERFFSMLDRWDKIFTLILGTAAFVRVFGETATIWLSIPFGILAAASLIFDFAEKARRHSQFAAEFKALEAEIEAKGERDFEESDLNVWASQRRRIEINEPVTHVIVARMCENEMARAIGQEQDVTRIPILQRWTAHLFLYSDSEIQQKK